jgi:hypothetical protein
MKKNIFIYLLLLVLSYPLGAQTGDNIKASSKYINYVVAKSGDATGVYFRNPPSKLKGSYHLFEDWDHLGIIKTTQDKSFKIENINFNIKDNRYESKIGNDSIFVFDLENVDYLLIDYRKFRSYNLPKNDANVIMEVIVDHSAFALLKEYKIDIKIGEPHPLMLEPTTDEYIIKSSYYIKRGNGIEKFKLSKKNILGLVSKENVKKMEQFVKENKLSYKKDKDVNQMLTYIMKN